MFLVGSPDNLNEIILFLPLVSFGTHRNFQSFDNVAASTAPTSAATMTSTNPNSYANVSPPQGYGGSFLDPAQAPAGNLYGQTDFGGNSYSGGDFDDEPPLLEGKHKTKKKF